MARQTDYAWAAGFVDGDGCISVQLQRGPKERKRKLYANIQVIVTQKTPEPLEHFRDIFGLDTKISLYDKRRGFTHWRFAVSGSTAADVLTRILPYLVFKRDVALVALDLNAEILKHKGSGQCLSDETWEYRKSLVAKAKWLNSGRWRERRAAAETKSEGTLSGDAIVRSALDGKGAEADRNDLPFEKAN